ncbi:protein croquemort [Harpegnathos saltator]|uniref:Scavenger receptor class B member 1 n=1 Tax=Harpegnathos saltator TaxID=610380 RepID=E2BT86_HARSA|nr:protein croquemort [Harpegnathos saltator]XP_011144692.1 protein croquemort [Harpegnathos saltator]EFN81088.1 Scavenger receptor class B member 1 [Harpegnathos saltator]
MRPWTNKSLSLGVIGLLLLVCGVSLSVLWPIIFHQILQKGLALTPTSRSFDVWNDTSNLPPMYFNIYMFNWTNPQELKMHGKKPHFVQVGPYVFREVRQKVNVTFHPTNKTVSYFQRRSWYFDAERSNGSLSDIINHLNIVAVSAAHKIRYWDYSFQKSLSIMLTSSKIYVTKTVGELLFTGYSDTLLTMGKMLVTDDTPLYDRFGWFYMRNNSAEMDGIMNMETGVDDISHLGIMRKWRYRDTTKYHRSPCNVIEGSASEFWPPNQTKEGITLFSVDLCRSVIYEYERTVSHMGIEGYRYTMDKKTLENDTRRRYPHEQAKYFEPTTTTEDFFAAEHTNEGLLSTTTESPSYGSSEERSSESSDDMSDDDPDVINMGNCYCNGECTPSGLINVSSCRYGAPVFMSLPHFHKTDPSLLNQIEGLNPNDGDYDFSITLEPTTGIPLEVAAKLQVNILVQPSEIVSLFKNVPRIYFPIMWFNLTVEITKEMASDLKQLLALPTVMLCTGVIMAIVGLCLIAAVALLYLVKKKPTPPAPAEVAPEKPVDEPLEKKSETVYMDKITANEDANVRSDRRLYAKLY